MISAYFCEFYHHANQLHFISLLILYFQCFLWYQHTTYNWQNYLYFQVYIIVSFFLSSVHWLKPPEQWGMIRMEVENFDLLLWRMELTLDLNYKRNLSFMKPQRALISYFWKTHLFKLLQWCILIVIGLVNSEKYNTNANVIHYFIIPK